MVDLGPGGGKKGGKISYCGTPEKISTAKDSETAKYILDKLK
jgi:excinuclease ABC subunit A